MLFLVCGVKNVWVVQLNRHAVMKHWSVDIVVASLLILQKNITCVRLKPRGRSLLLCHTISSSALVSMITAGRLYDHSSVSAVRTPSACFWWEFIARTVLRTDSHFLNKNSLPASHYLKCSITNAAGMLDVLTWLDVWMRMWPSFLHAAVKTVDATEKWNWCGQAGCKHSTGTCRSHTT